MAGTSGRGIRSHRALRICGPGTDARSKFRRQSPGLGDRQQEIPVVAAKPTIAIYHTHSDESYVPTDGKESKEGNGAFMT